MRKPWAVRLYTVTITYLGGGKDPLQDGHLSAASRAMFHGVPTGGGKDPGNALPGFI